MGADVGRDLYGNLVSFLYALAVQDGCAERPRERVASAYCVGNLHFRRVLEGRNAWREDIRAVGATGKYQHLQTIGRQNLLAGLAHVQTLVAEEMTEGYHLLVVNLQHVAALQRLLDNVLGEELLTQVDVENLQAVLGGVIQELADGCP